MIESYLKMRSTLTRCLLGLCLVLSLGMPLSAQDDTLSISVTDTIVDEGAIAEVYLSVADFDSLVSMQFSINWDPTVIEFLEQESVDLNSIAVGESEAGIGNLRFSWFDPQGIPQTLDDGDQILLLRFQAVGELGTFSPVEITGDPLEIQVRKESEDGGAFTPVALQVDQGSVQIGEQLIVDIDFTESVCAGDSTGTISLQTNADPDIFTIAWFDAGGNELPADALDNLPAGVYELRIIDETGNVVFTTTREILEIAPPILDLGPSTQSLCDEMSITLEPEEVSENVDFRWSDGSQQTQLAIAVPGTYSLTVTNAAGCTATDSVLVLEGGDVVANLASPLFPICPGDSIALDVEGGTDFSWLGDTQGLNRTDSRQVLASPDSSRSYQVAVFDGCGGDTLDIAIEVFEVVATAGEDTCVVIGDRIQLMASGGLFYEWEPNSLYPVDDPTSATPFVSPFEQTTYAVLIEDINGCLTRDEVVVSTAENPAETIVAINTITPNNDGDNDVLDFGDIEKFGSNSLRVYSRWGRLVYNKVDYQADDERFGGDFAGEALPAGTYYYVLEFRTGTIKQSLLIVR